MPFHCKAEFLVLSTVLMNFVLAFHFQKKENLVSFLEILNERWIHWFIHIFRRIRRRDSNRYRIGRYLVWVWFDHTRDYDWSYCCSPRMISEVCHSIPEPKFQTTILGVISERNVSVNAWLIHFVFVAALDFGHCRQFMRDFDSIMGVRCTWWF